MFAPPLANTTGFHSTDFRAIAFVPYRNLRLHILNDQQLNIVLVFVRLPNLLKSRTDMHLLPFAALSCIATWHDQCYFLRTKQLYIFQLHSPDCAFVSSLTYPFPRKSNSSLQDRFLGGGRGGSQQHSVSGDRSCFGSMCPILPPMRASHTS